jgi:hypothetical protein
MNPEYNPQAQQPQGPPVPGFAPAPPAPGSPAAAPAPAPAKKPWYLRWWAFAIAAVLVLSCFGSLVGNGDGEPAADDTAITSGTETSAAEIAGEEAEPAGPEEPDYFADAFPVFEAVTESGSGDSVVNIPAAQGIITASHSGSSNFSLTVLDANNEMAELPVNTIGDYEGTTAFGLSTLGGEASAVEITADGDWEITFAPISAAPEMADPQEATGDGVFRYTGDAAIWNTAHDGESNFSITFLSDGSFGWNLLVNEIGAYGGTVPVTAGPAVVVVTADGDWTIASA